MIRGIYTSASGMTAELFRQQVTTNNMANCTSPGFKRDLAVIQSFPEMEHYETRTMAIPQKPVGRLSTGVAVGGAYLDSSSGPLQPTGRDLDIALSAPNTYIAASRGGSTVYLRTASLRVDSSGYLITAGGDMVQSSSMSPIYVGQGETPWIDESGHVHSASGLRGSLRLVQFPNPRGLQKVEGGAVVQTDSSGSPYPADVKVLVGYLEASNASPVKEMAELISIMRAYEANQRAIHAQDETLDKAVNEIGRV